MAFRFGSSDEVSFFLVEGFVKPGRSLPDGFTFDVPGTDEVLLGKGTNRLLHFVEFGLKGKAFRDGDLALFALRSELGYCELGERSFADYFGFGSERAGGLIDDA